MEQFANTRISMVSHYNAPGMSVYQMNIYCFVTLVIMEYFYYNFYELKCIDLKYTDK